MNKSTEWYISGAIWLCGAFFLYMIRTSLEQQAFWYGTSYMPPISVAILNLGPILVPSLIFLGVVCFVVGLSKAGVVTVSVKGEPPLDNGQTLPPVRTKRSNSETQKETVIKEYIMTPCEQCEALIPQTSTFCPDCGVRRKE